jgi:hypothetical protein
MFHLKFIILLDHLKRNPHYTKYQNGILCSFQPVSGSSSATILIPSLLLNKTQDLYPGANLDPTLTIISQLVFTTLLLFAILEKTALLCLALRHMQTLLLGLSCH